MNTEEVVKTGGFGLPWMLGLFAPPLIHYNRANKAQRLIQMGIQRVSGVSRALDSWQVILI